MAAILENPATIGVSAPSAPIVEVGTDRRRAFADGMRRMLPWLVGVTPYGLVIGTTISSGSVPGLAGWLGGPLIYGGSAHLSVLELLDRSASLLVVLATGVIVNSRILLYSAALAPHWRGSSIWYRLVASAMIADPTFAVGMEIHRSHRGSAARLRYLGAGFALTVAWLASISLGMAVGAGLPEGLPLDYAIPIYIVAHLVGMGADRPPRLAAVGAAVVALVAAGAPLHLGVVIGIVAGVMVGHQALKKETAAYETAANETTGTETVR